jgi:hypothetical protein
MATSRQIKHLQNMIILNDEKRRTIKNVIVLYRSRLWANEIFHSNYTQCRLAFLVNDNRGNLGAKEDIFFDMSEDQNGLLAVFLHLSTCALLLAESMRPSQSSAKFFQHGHRG